MADPTWEDIPYNQNASPEIKADNFDRQYDENKANGDAKEASGAYRREPEGRGYGR